MMFKKLLTVLTVLAGFCLSLGGVGHGLGATTAEASQVRRDVRELAASAPTQISEQLQGLLRQRLHESLYRVRSSEDGDGAVYEAANPAQGFRVQFSESGFRVLGAGALDAGWGLELMAYGYRDELSPIEPAAPTVHGNRVEYRRGSMVEWYVNDERGLEQGFTLLERPGDGQRPELDPRKPEAGAASLILRMRAEGGLTAREGDGTDVFLTDRAGEEVLSYRGLAVWDARGTRLPAQVRAAENELRIEVDDSAAVYPVTVDPFIESAKIQASDKQAGDQFGFSAAISGDTAIVGALFEKTGGRFAGAAYIFSRNQGGANNWGEVVKIQASDKQAGDEFGFSVAISGDTAIVGALQEDTGAFDAGAAYIFERNQGGPESWGEVRKIQASDKEGQSWFGSSVAISGSTAIVGARLDDTGDGNAGAAYIFQRDRGGANNWGEVEQIQASDKQAGDEFGFSVAISGDTAIVGSPDEDTGGRSAGAAYVFERNQGGTDNWGEVTKIQASDKQEQDVFGFSVAISSDTAIVGSPLRETAVLAAGAAYIFERNQGGTDNWGEAKKIQASDKQAFDRFGFSVAISGDIAIVGAIGEGIGGSSTGAAYSFERDEGGANNWGEVKKIQASDRERGDALGGSVAISGDTTIVGADDEDTGGIAAGAAYIFELAPTAEGMIQALIADVDELAATGVLNIGQANSLTTKLRSALLSLDKGRDIAAANKLMAFINQVEAFVAAGILTEAQAQPLIDQAIAAIDDILGD